MTAPINGALLAEAACLAERASRDLIAALLRIEAAGLEPTDDVLEVVEDVADISSGLIQLADDIGAAEVARREATA